MALTNIIKSLDFRKSIGRKSIKCNKCHSKFFIELKEGKNRIPKICDKCVNKEFENAILKMQLSKIEKDYLGAKSSNIPLSFIKESLTNFSIGYTRKDRNDPI